MKKLLFLMGKLNAGGAERVLVDTVNRLPADQYDITVCLVENEGVYIKDLKPHIHFQAITSPENPLRKKWFYRLYRYLGLKGCYSWFVPGDYDVEIAFLEGLATHVIGCSNRKNVRKIAWVHTDMDQNRWADVDYRNEEQQRSIYSRFDDIVFVSHFAQQQFARRFGPISRQTVLYNVVDDQAVRRKALQFNEAEKYKRCFTVVSSGRFTPQKGFDRLLQIHRRLLNEGVEHDLWLLGDGAMRPELERYVDEHSLKDSVRFWGFQENPYPIMAQADLFVCSSRSEGYSTVVSEAFLLGLPVLSVTCSGAGELLQNGISGVLVENKDESLYRAMKQLIESPELCVQYAERSKLRGQDFSTEERLRQLQAFLNQ